MSGERECPYCEDGVLTQLDGDEYEYQYECSNFADCPAGFVAVFET